MFDTLDMAVANGVATISLDRPASLNAFNAPLRHELLEAIESTAENDKVRVVVIRANGRAFCAGADLRESYPPGQTVQQRMETEYKPLLLAINGSVKPVIAAVQGAAAGIGCALAMNCDLIVMGESAYFYQAFSALGIVPDGGLTWHLPRQIGAKRAYELIVTGEKLPAKDCLAMGLVNRVVEDDALDTETESLAQQLLSRAPLSLRYSKEAIQRASELSLGDAISMEAELQLLLYATDDYAEGKAAFLEKRKPIWKGQ